MKTRVVVVGVVVVLLVAGGIVWKWRSGLTPHYEKATVCGIKAELVEELFETDRFVERYGFGRRCTVSGGGDGVERTEIEFMATPDDAPSWPRRLRRVEAREHRMSFSGGRAGYDRDEDSMEGTWVCSRYWPGLSAISVLASDVEGSTKAFGKALRAAADYAASCAADPLDSPFEEYEAPTACGMSTDHVASVLGTRLFRGGDPDPLPLGDRRAWSCAAVSDSVDGEVGSVAASVDVDERDWEGEHQRIGKVKDSFEVADGRAYVDRAGPRASAFWACDLGPDVDGGGAVVTIGAGGVSQKPVSLDDMRAMVSEIAEQTGCSAAEK